MGAWAWALTPQLPEALGCRLTPHFFTSRERQGSAGSQVDLAPGAPR